MRVHLLHPQRFVLLLPQRFGVGRVVVVSSRRVVEMAVEWGRGREMVRLRGVVVLMGWLVGVEGCVG